MQKNRAAEFSFRCPVFCAMISVCPPSSMATARILLRPAGETLFFSSCEAVMTPAVKLNYSLFSQAISQNESS